MDELRELKLYVWNADMSAKIPVSVVSASQSDIKATKDWLADELDFFGGKYPVGL